MKEIWQAVDACFGRFCLTVGIDATQATMAADVEDLCRTSVTREARSAMATPGRALKVTKPSDQRLDQISRSDLANVKVSIA